MTESELKEQARFAGESVELFRAAIEWAEREGESMTMAVRENRFTGTDARRVLDLVDSLRSARKDAERLAWAFDQGFFVWGEARPSFLRCATLDELRGKIDASREDELSRVPSSTQEEQ